MPRHNEIRPTQDLYTDISTRKVAPPEMRSLEELDEEEKLKDESKFVPTDEIADDALDPESVLLKKESADDENETSEVSHLDVRSAAAQIGREREDRRVLENEQGWSPRKKQSQADELKVAAPGRPTPIRKTISVETGVDTYENRSRQPRPDTYKTSHRQRNLPKSKTA